MSISNKFNYFINVSGLDVEIDRKDIKNLHIGVYPPYGKIRIATPLHLDNEAIKLAVISRLGWIKRQRANFFEQPRQSKREMVSGESHYLFGKRYLLDVIYRQGKHQIVKKHSKLELYVKPNTTRENRLLVLNEYYRQELKKEIKALLLKWEIKIGIKFNFWQIKKMKTKWGSCNIKDKRVLFNLELSKVSIEAIEYIIVHEILHLIERHHNDNFRLLMTHYLPNWNSLKKELNSSYLLDI